MSNSKYSKKLNEILDVGIHKRAKNLNHESANCYDLVHCILSDNKSNVAFILSYMDISIKEMSEELFKEYYSSISEEVKEDSEEDLDENSTPCVSLTKRASSILRSAEKIADNNNDDEIRCEHILTAILKYRGDGEDLLYMKNVFSKYGITYDDFWGTFRMSLEEDGLKQNMTKNSPRPRRRGRSQQRNRTQGEPPVTKEINPEDKTQKFLSEFISNGQISDVNQFVQDNYMEFVGRDQEIERCIRILCRKQKCNLLIIGESGTGKTSLIYNLVQRINRGEVPGKIANKKVFQIFIDNMVAGTKYRGQFEERMKNVFRIISLYGKEQGMRPVVFFDEIHTIIGAGSAEGSASDAVGMIKPKMSSEEIQCIGTTTMNEFRKYILKDQALMRRFSTIFLEEPNEEQTYHILRGVKHLYEDHHKVHIDDEIVKETVKISGKYIKDRFFPDKAIDVLDEACAKTIQEYGKEVSKGVYLDLTKETVYDVISEATQIPISFLNSDDRKKLRNLAYNMKKGIFGQDEIIEEVCSAVITGRSGFRDSEKPIGTFLFIGTTGVGKTMIAKQLSTELFGNESIIRLDMSEYMEKYSMSRIVGSPPGYVGYDDGGQLCEQVKKRPYSVLLLDEIEKAHPDVINLFLQVFDEGRLTDSTGRYIDFRNTIIIMTSNLSAAKIGKIKKMGFHATIDTMSEKKEVEKFLNEEVKKFFAPELVNRIDEILVFNKLNEENIKRILSSEFEKVRERVKAKGLDLVLRAKVKDFLSEKGFDPDFGARPMKRTLKKYVEDPLAKMYVEGEIAEGNTVYISLNKENPEVLSFSVKK